MKRTLVLFAAALMLVGATCAARLEVTATAPRYLTAGECANDTTHAIAQPVTMHFRYMSTVRGGAAGEDSVIAQPGALVEWGADVPQGLFRVSAWASNAAGAGCQDTATVFAGGVPGPVVIQRGPQP